MLCDNCKKRPASVHITEINNHQKSERHLCEQCAQNNGEISFAVSPSFSVQDLLKGMFKVATPESVQPHTEVICPNCGLAYSDFSRNGKIGCSVCYQAFERRLEPLLRRLHGNNIHTGKIPKRAGVRLEVEQRIKQLRKQIEQHVNREEYEQAAKIRDEVKALEKDVHLHKEG
ncbi:MAG: UvrB/UvrC motif-containing protein [Negativicutes bacterium]